MQYWQRTMCDALDEMRKCFKCYNFAPIKGLIEEVQIMANRMESKLELIHDFEHLEKKHKYLIKKIEKLKLEAGDD